MDAMKIRLSNGLDPLTGEIMETVGSIKIASGVCRDATGREVVLNDKGTWIYRKNDS